jgi:hypothetical protein
MDLLQENALGVKVASGETILTKYLNGYVDTVVVTGNEYASLTDDEPTATGKTEVNGKTLLNWTTGRDEIGSSYVIWATKGGAQKNDTVVYSELSADNAYYETDAATKGALDAKTTGLNLATAEKFVNFSNSDVYTTTIKLTYTKMVDKTGDNGAYDYDEATDEYVKSETGAYDLGYVTVKAGEEVNTDELKDVFKYNALSVYVGTYNKNDNANYVDQSDDMNYNKFVDKYLKVDTDATGALENVNGNYIKVIDNDGDGVAEYVLKTTYSLDKISTLNAKGVATFAELNYGKKDTISLYDDAAAGDVVVITGKIDGVYYVEKAPSFEGVVTTVSYKNTTITVDGEEYGQSAIAIDDNDDTNGVSDKLELFTSIMKADEKTDYVFYTDLYGYVRAYEYVEPVYNYALLTEAYNTLNYRSQVVRSLTGTAELTIGDAKTAEYTVTNQSYTGKSNVFFSNNENADATLVPAIAGKSITNVAAYVNLDTDANTVALYTAKTDKAANIKAIDVIELDSTAAVSAKARSYKAAANSNYNYVSATAETEYYFVTVNVDQYGNSTTVKSIAYRTGYGEVPAIAADDIQAAYAVATINGKDASTSTYGVANVVVFELKGDVLTSADDTILGYYTPSKTTSKVRAIDAILGDATLGTVNEKVDWSDEDYEAIGFYDVYENSDESVTLKAVTDYSARGIYAGKIDRINGLKYVKIGTTASGSALDLSDVPVYALSTRPGSTVVTAEATTLTAANVGDGLIWVTKANGSINYAVLVEDDSTITQLTTLYTNITNSGVKGTTANEPTITFFGQTGKTVSHSVAKAFLGANATDATVKGNIVSVSAANDGSVVKTYTVDVDTYTLGTAAATFNVTIVVESEDGNTTKVYTETLTKSKADDDATLVPASDAIAVDEANTAFGLKDGTKIVNIDQLMKMVKANAGTSELTWAFKGNDGVDYTKTTVNGAWDVDTFDSIKVTVTPESGASDAVTYTYEDMVKITLANETSKDAATWAFESDLDGAYVKAGGAISGDVTVKFQGSKYTGTTKIYVSYKVDSGTETKNIEISSAGTNGIVAVTGTAGDEDTTITITRLENNQDS